MTTTTWIALVGAVSVWIAGGEDVAAQPRLTLATAQAEARAHAPDAAALAARIQGAEAVARQAGRVFRIDPEVSASGMSGSLVGRPDDSAWTVGARWTVDLSRSWVPRRESAARDLQRTLFERDDGLRALDERVAVAFADVALAQRLLARDERLRELQDIAAQAEHRRLDAGAGSELEADAADLDLAGARTAEEQAQGDLATARVRLGRLLGRPGDSTLGVDDSDGWTTVSARPDIDALVDRDPRVQAAVAELDAARFEQAVAERLLRPMPTVGLDAGSQGLEIPKGSFRGLPLADASAAWHEPELSFSVSVPLPLFERQQEPRARATARILAAEAQLAVARADVRAELLSAWDGLLAAQRALDAVQPTSGLVARDLTFVDRAVRAGAFDAVTRTQTLRRLEEAGRRFDAAVRDVSVARAAWIRATAGSSP